MKAKEILSALGNILKKIEFAEAKLDNGTVLVSDDFAEGSSIFIKVEDDDTKVPLPIGEYDMEDGKKLIVIEEGIIGKIGEVSTDPAPDPENTELNTNNNNTEMKEKLEEVEKELEHEDGHEKEMSYVSREELDEAVAEVKEMIEEVKAKLEEAKDEEKVEAEEKEELKKELSKASTRPIRHNPEARGKTNLKNISPNRVRNSIMDRVMENISRIN